MRSPAFLACASCFALLLLAAAPSAAKPRGEPVLALDAVEVLVVFDRDLVTTVIEQTWRNPTAQPQEIDLFVPVPAGGAVTEFRMAVGSEAIAAELLPRADAKRAYLETVRRQQDPALLAHAGDRALRARAFPVEAGGTRTVRISWVQPMATRGGLLRTEVVPAVDRPEHDRIGTLRVEVKAETAAPLVTLYSPSHPLDVSRFTAHRARATYTGRMERPGQPILLYAASSPDEMGMRVLTHRPPGEDGTFLLLGAPPALPKAEAGTEASAQRTVLFVFDRSGSMKGRKVEQVRSALRFCLHSLVPTDRFDLVTFNDTASAVFGRPRPATPEAVAAALERVGSIEADGGTNIQAALLAALDEVPAGASADIVFLTDGLPTVGERHGGAIRRAFTQRNEGRARLFTFGVGDDVDVPFLDALALEARGFPTVVRPTEDVEVAVSDFFRGITRPVLRDLALTAEGVALHDVQPRVLPDLFAGRTLTVLGRYRGAGKGRIVLEGRRGEETVRHEVDVTFPEEAREHAFLPALWAARKVGHLIDDIREHGPEPELVDAVVSLALRHGIVTEYTAFLLDVDAMDPATLRARAAQAFRAGGEAWRGGWAQSQARNKEAMKRAAALREAGGYEDADGRWVDLSSRVARVSPYVFLRRPDGTWVDAGVRGAGDAVPVHVGGERYRELVATSDLFARVAALGAPVLLRWEGTRLHLLAP